MDIKDIQIKILTETISSLIRENAELRSCIIVQNDAIKAKEVPDGEHQDSTVDSEDNGQ